MLELLNWPSVVVTQSHSSEAIEHFNVICSTDFIG